MWNNKRIRSVLFVAMVAVWGMVIYRITSYSSTTDSGNIQSAGNSKNEVAFTDTLSLSYPDPFFRNISLKEEAIQEETACPQPDKKPPRVNIEYVGRIRNGDREFCIIQNRNEQYMLTVGDTIEKLTLSKICKDSVLFELDDHLIVKHLTK